MNMRKIIASLVNAIVDCLNIIQAESRGYVTNSSYMNAKNPSTGYAIMMLPIVSLDKVLFCRPVRRPPCYTTFRALSPSTRPPLLLILFRLAPLLRVQVLMLPCQVVPRALQETFVLMPTHRVSR